MFDNFLSSLKTQTSQLSSSFNDARHRLSLTTMVKNKLDNSNGGTDVISNRINSNQISQTHHSSTLSKSKSMIDSITNVITEKAFGESSDIRYSGSYIKKNQLGSSVSLDHSLETVVTRNHIYSEEFSTDGENETVFRNPAHLLKNDSEEEECLVDKFDRVLASVQGTANEKKNREEIRKRLAMGIDMEVTPSADVYKFKSSKKSKFKESVDKSMNLQICFINEKADGLSDLENQIGNDSPKLDISVPAAFYSEIDFLAHQAKLQKEARSALAKSQHFAKEKMMINKQQLKPRRIHEIICQSLEKKGIRPQWDCRRLNHQILTVLNIAQLQVIVNDLHTQIEELNEELVKFLLTRDDSHIQQDSMLVYIEDLTRYLN